MSKLLKRVIVGHGFLLKFFLVDRSLEFEDVRMFMNIRVEG
jgi:hypothetical protein